MSVEIVVAWIAAAGSLGSAAVSWSAQRAAARAAAAAERQAAVVAAKTDVWTSDKSIYVEQVTAERGIWRGELRQDTAAVVAWVSDASKKVEPELAALSRIALRLNPAGRSENAKERDQHPLDRDIYDVIASIRSTDDPHARHALADRLEGAVALLLKQEWQVSKKEARRTDLV